MPPTEWPLPAKQLASLRGLLQRQWSLADRAAVLLLQRYGLEAPLLEPTAPHEPPA